MCVGRIPLFGIPLRGAVIGFLPVHLDEGRQEEGQGLAAARGRDADDVLAPEAQGPAVGLGSDRCHRLLIVFGVLPFIPVCLFVVFLRERHTMHGA